MLETVKNYLRIDGDDDDEMLKLFITDAKEYITAAVGVFPEKSATAKVILLAYVQNRYDNRELMQSDQQVKKRMEYTFKSALTQLQVEYGGEEDEGIKPRTPE